MPVFNEHLVGEDLFNTAEYPEITFVDDKLNHLVKVSHLGVRPVLAGWGFNTHREHSLAREQGIEVAGLGSVDTVLFKGE